MFRYVKPVLLTASAVSVGAVCATYFYDSRAAFHSLVSMPLLRLLDPEKAHTLAITFVKNRLSPIDTQKDSHCLKTNVNNIIKIDLG